MKQLLILVLCFGISYLKGQNASIASLEKTIEEVTHSEVLKHGILGVAVVEVSSNAVLASENADKSIIPASTLKLVTTATALQRLGKEYTFITSLYLDGKVEAATLKGNLIIKGAGDPTLASSRFSTEDFFAKCIQTLKEKGITSISGNIIADNSYFEGTPTPPGWTWEDMGNYYGSGVFGLNLYDNTYHIIFESGFTPGDPTLIKGTEPSIPGLNFTNTVTSGHKNGDYAYVYGAPYSNDIYVTGTVTKGRSEFKRTKGCIPNPPLFLAQELKKKMGEAEIAHEGEIVVLLEKRSYNNTELLYTHSSPPLGEIVKETNAESVNLYAETLLLQAFHAENNTISTLQAADLMTEYWGKWGIDTDGLHLYDGSGLTRKNTITPKQLALIAAKALKNDTTFYQYFPCAGKEGTVKYMCQNTAAEGSVWMKSGTLDRVRNYAGYAMSKNGKWVAFSIMTNDFSSSSAMKTQLEAIITKIAELDF